MDRRLPDADLYHLHWIAEFVDYRALLYLQQRAPIIWTLHDINPFTGGCHFAFDCDAFASRCTDCPQLSVQNHHSQSHAKQIWDLKNSIFQRLNPKRIKFIAPSSWIQKEANRSMLLRRFETMLVPNGVDHTRFHPLDKLEVKKSGCVPTDKTVIMLCAVNLNDKFKGISYAIQAIKELPHPERFCVITVGNGSVSQMFENHEIQVIELGSIKEESEMNRAYNAADLLVISSVQDNLPNVVLEAMACALPVVAFATGGIPDMVQHDVTGFLVSTGDTQQLTQSIQTLADHPDTQKKMGHEARALVEKTFTLSRQASRISEVYEDLLHC